MWLTPLYDYSSFDLNNQIFIIMKKITLLVALVLLSFVVKAQEATGFTDQTTWLNNCNAGTLTTEDFMGGPTIITLCDGVISSDGNNCYPEGEIQEGFDLIAEISNPIGYYPANTFGNNQPVLGPNEVVDYTRINFRRTNITRVGLQLFNLSEAAGVIRLYDRGGFLYDTLDVNISGPDTSFFGIVSTIPIGRIELENEDGTGYYLNNLSYGTCNDTCTSEVFFPEGSFPFNIEIDPGSTSTADCVNAPNLVPITVTSTGVLGEDATLVSIFFDIEHTFTGDLELSLISPAGTELLIVADQGGGVNNGYVGTQFADDAADITEATAPYGEAFFAPQGGRFDATFFGESITGDWMIKICDDASEDTGQLVNAGIFFCAQEASNPPVNDLIENAIDVDELGFPYTDSDINFPAAMGEELSNTNGCDAAANFISVWYKFTATADGMATASINPTNTNSFIIFYSAADENATVDNLTFVNSGTNSCGFEQEKYIEAVAGQTYYVLASSSVVNTVTIDLSMPPPNDLIENAIDVDEIGFPYTDSDINFPDAMGEQLSNTNGCDANASFISVWYKFTAFADGMVTASITSTDPDSAVLFYSAADENATVDNLTFESSGTNLCAFEQEQSIEAVAGQTYYVLVLSNAVGSVTIDSDTVLSTEENTIEGFSFFPNPVEDVLNVSANQSIDQITLYNITGQKVIEQKINATNTQLSVGNLPSGIYLMNATSGQTTSTYKIIKK